MFLLLAADNSEASRGQTSGVPAMIREYWSSDLATVADQLDRSDALMRRMRR
jgi:hypothetical protein